MAIPKSTQTRFLGIRDNHNHYIIYIPTLTFLDYNINVDSCYPWSVLDLHVGEIMFSLSIIFIILLIIYDPHATQKASVGMYSGCDYLLSLKILFMCFLPSLLHPSILFSCFYTCFCSFYCMSATIYIKYRWEVPKFA